jgi:ADP-glucose pyrophosphorylase
MKIDDKGRILSFSEKPKGAELKGMVSLMFIVMLIINILQVSRIRFTANIASRFSKWTQPFLVFRRRKL